MHTANVRERAPETKGRTIRWASWYDAVVALLSLGREQAMRQMTLELAQVKPGDKVLDVGCGTGSLTIAAKARTGAVGQVHGIDAAPEMIDIARRKAAQAGVDVDFQIGLIEKIPFPDNHFDIALSSLMLHHLPDDLKRKGVVEINRVLKPSGRFFAVDFEPPSSSLLWRLTFHLLGHGMMQSNVRKLPAMMAAAGFVDVETGTTNYHVLAFVRGRKGVDRSGFQKPDRSG